jgi:hypothetical protein
VGTPFRKFGRITIVVALVAFVVAIGAMQSTASAAPNQQCLVKVTGQQANGMFILGPQTCYATYADVLRSVGVTNVSDSISPATVSPAILQAGSILGTHYDGANLTGASFSVGGTTCGGGGLNLPTSWNDRISSTANGCEQIVHWENANFGGASVDILAPGGNITGYMDNKTSSIQYFG